ncbi:hypothetical protein N9B38_00560 [bacterium]|nr:hypothetical protein [bacterium]
MAARVTKYTFFLACVYEVTLSNVYFSLDLEPRERVPLTDVSLLKISFFGMNRSALPSSTCMHSIQDDAAGVLLSFLIVSHRPVLER